MYYNCHRIGCHNESMTEKHYISQEKVGYLFRKRGDDNVQAVEVILLSKSKWHVSAIFSNSVNLLTQLTSTKEVSLFFSVSRCLNSCHSWKQLPPSPSLTKVISPSRVDSLTQSHRLNWLSKTRASILGCGLDGGWKHALSDARHISRFRLSS